MSTVSPDEIRAVPARYAIGKRPLSILLGWGELTYTRLLDGNTPTARHASMELEGSRLGLAGQNGFCQIVIR